MVAPTCLIMNKISPIRVAAMPPKRSDDRNQTGDVKPDWKSCYTEQSDDAATAEWSASSGDSFADIPFKANSSKRGILRDESNIFKSQEKPPHQRKRIVQFSSVSIRYYDIILGYHPCCSRGPPLTIDWDYQENEAVHVDEYEFENARTRRCLRDLALNHRQRKCLLQGYSEVDFNVAMKEVKRIKRNRNVTRQLAPYHPVEAIVESACRKFKRIVLKQEG